MTPEDKEYFDKKFDMIRDNINTLNKNLELVFDAVLIIKRDMEKSEVTKLVEKHIHEQ